MYAHRQEENVSEYTFSYSSAIFLALKCEWMRLYPASAIRVRSSGLEISFLRAFARAVESSGGTSIPLSLTISGIPPTLEATIGKGIIIASRFTSPNPSRRDGRQKMLELFRRRGILFFFPSRMA